MNATDMRQKVIQCMDEIEQSLSKLQKETGCTDVTISPILTELRSQNQQSIYIITLNEITFQLQLGEVLTKDTIASLNQNFDDIQWGGNGTKPTIELKVRRRINE